MFSSEHAVTQGSPIASGLPGPGIARIGDDARFRTVLDPFEQRAQLGQLGFAVLLPTDEIRA